MKMKQSIKVTRMKTNTSVSNSSKEMPQEEEHEDENSSGGSDDSSSANSSSVISTSEEADQMISTAQKQAMSVIKFRSVAVRNPKSHMLNVGVKHLDLENLAMALSGQPLDVDHTTTHIARQQDKHFVRTGLIGGVSEPGTRNGRELMHRKYIEIYSPKGEPRLRLE